MRIKDMTDEQLVVARKVSAMTPGKYSQKRFLNILTEETRREEQAVEKS
jgi:hypothetical protein